MDEPLPAIKDDHGAYTFLHASVSGAEHSRVQCCRRAALRRPSRPRHLHALQLSGIPTLGIPARDQPLLREKTHGPQASGAGVTGHDRRRRNAYTTGSDIRCGEAGDEKKADIEVSGTGANAPAQKTQNAESKKPAINAGFSLVWCTRQDSNL